MGRTATIYQAGARHREGVVVRGATYTTKDRKKPSIGPAVRSGTRMADKAEQAERAPRLGQRGLTPRKNLNSGGSLTRQTSLRHRLSGRPPDDPPKDKASSLMISGAAAGAVSKLLTAPVDRVKIMYQVSSSRQFSISAGIRTAADIIRTSGFTALWRGNSIAIMRDVPYASIMFTSFSFIQEAVCGLCGRPPGLAERAFAGCAAGAIATVLTYPLDMLRARFGAEWAAQPRYTSYSAGVREIIRREGIAALFAGLRPTLLGIMPYSALSFAAFETFSECHGIPNPRRSAHPEPLCQLQ